MLNRLEIHKLIAFMDVTEWNIAKMSQKATMTQEQMKTSQRWMCKQKANNTGNYTKVPPSS